MSSQPFARAFVKSNNSAVVSACKLVGSRRNHIGGKTAGGYPKPDAPAVLDPIERAERSFNGVAQALGGTPADPRLGRDLVKGQSFRARRQRSGQFQRLDDLRVSHDSQPLNDASGSDAPASYLFHVRFSAESCLA